MSTAGPTIVAIVACLAAALCAAADGALLALDDGRAGEPELARLYADRERAHRTLSFARLAALLAAGAAAALALRLAERPRPAALLLGFAVATVVITLTETTARAAGTEAGARLARRLAPLVRALDVVLAPAVWLGARIESALQRALPPPPHDEVEREATAEQFRQVVAAEAYVTRDEEALLHGVFSMGDTEVQDVMVPRVDIVGIERSMPWSEVVDRVRSSEHARFPVYEETLDEISGILYAKDLLPAVLRDAPPEGGWLQLVRPAVFIPATKRLGEQLREFKSSHTHIAIVVDEYGGTAGLVTIEDVLEEIVGDIHDEYDVEPPAIEQEEGRKFWVSGRLTLEELSAALDHEFTSEDVTTVGGLVYERLGRVPHAGEAFALGGFRVVVERVVRRKVERVYFERVEALTGRPSE